MPGDLEKFENRINEAIGKKDDSPAGKMIAYGIVTLFVTILFYSIFFENIEAGHVMVGTKGGKEGDVKESGFAFVVPWGGYTDVRTNTQELRFIEDDAAGDNKGSITVMTSDNLNVNIDISILYEIDNDDVGKVIVEQGVDFRDHALLNVIRNEPREAATNYTAIELISDRRAEFEDVITSRISERLEEYYITVQSINVRGIRIPASLENAINEKKVAEQRVQTAIYELEAQEHIANKIIVNATAQKNATIINAEAQAESIRIVMEQLSQDDTNMSSTEAYLNYLYMLALTDPNSNIRYVISDGSTPILLNEATE